MKLLNDLQCTVCGALFKEHDPEQLQNCKLVSEIVNIQKPAPKPEIATPSQRCDKCHLYENMGNSLCPACGYKF